MTAGASHLKGAFHIVLSLHIAEIEGEIALCFGKFGARIDYGRFQRLFAIEQLHHLRNVVHAIHLQIVDDSGFGSVFFGQDKSLEVEFACQNSHRQRAFNFSYRPIESQFTHNHVFAQPIGGHHFVGSQGADSDRQIVGRAFLFDVGRRHVNHHRFVRERESSLIDGAFHALRALLHGSVGQSHNHDLRAPIEGGFNRDHSGINALHCGGYRFAEHNLF